MAARSVPHVHMANPPATEESRCAYCNRVLSPSGPSDTYCTQDCQRAWMSARALDAHDVYNRIDYTGG